MRISGSRALITGGGTGIGRAIAESLIQLGGRVVIMGRREDVLKKTADEIGAVAMPGDVSQEEHARKAMNTFVEEFGGIDILVNNAGFGRWGLVHELELKDFQEVMNTNVQGAFLMTREATPHFIKQQSGNLVNISSTAGTKGFQHGTAYCASKFALKGMTECWRDELRRHNVRVYLVNPSEVQTPFGNRDTSEVNPKKLTAKEIADSIVGLLHMDDRGFVPEYSVFATNPF